MINKYLVPDYNESESFLKNISIHDDLAENEEPTFTFQTFDDDSSKKDKNLAKQFHGTFSEHKESLLKLNNKGAGVFVTINKTDLTGRTAENILWNRAYFIDSDNGPITDFSLKPNMIVSTFSGEHAYWLTTTKDDPILFKPLQRRLSSYYKTDSSVCDPSRVMRLPGFYHLKNPLNPTIIKIKETSNRQYTHEDIFMSVVDYKEVSL